MRPRGCNGKKIRGENHPNQKAKALYVKLENVFYFIVVAQDVCRYLPQNVAL